MLDGEIPLELVSDNAMQFTSADFKAFSEKYGFTHTTSSPHYLYWGNELKGLFKQVLKQPDPYLALVS